MIAASNTLLSILCIVVTAYWIILLVKVVLSWAMLFGFRPPLSGPVRALIDLLDDVTEPVLKPLRTLIPPVRAGGMGLDLSVVVAFVILIVLQQVVCR